MLLNFSWLFFNGIYVNNVHYKISAIKEEHRFSIYLSLLLYLISHPLLHHFHVCDLLQMFHRSICGLGRRIFLDLLSLRFWIRLYICHLLILICLDLRICCLKIDLCIQAHLLITAKSIFPLFFIQPQKCLQNDNLG